MIPAGFWGSFGLLSCVLWGRASCLELVSVAVNRILLGVGVSSWQERLEGFGMEVHAPGMSLCPIWVLCRVFDFYFSPPLEVPK